MGRSRMWRFAVAGWAVLAAPLSAQEQGAWRLTPQTDLSAMLDCFEAAGQTLISAHRGGPTPERRAMRQRRRARWLAGEFLALGSAFIKLGQLHLVSQ